MPEDRTKGPASQSVNASRNKQSQRSPERAEAGDRSRSDHSLTGNIGLSPAGGREQPKNDRRKRGDLQKRALSPMPAAPSGDDFAN